MAREQVSEVARAKSRLRAAARSSARGSALVKTAVGVVGLLRSMRPQRRQDGTLAGKTVSVSPRPLVVLAGAAAAALTAGLLLRRSAGGR